MSNAGLPGKPGSGMLPPLSAAVFSIMMALVDGEKHGYAIMQTIETETNGTVRMGPGTLYGSLDRMLRAQLITETEGTDGPAPRNERRRYYRLTDFGEGVLRAEVERLQRAVALARRKKLISASHSVATSASLPSNMLQQPGF